jgi:hypothetical protein
MHETYDDSVLMSLRSWLAARRARHEIEAMARHYCASAKVSYRRGAIPWHLSFLIATSTDKERDALRSEPNLYQQFCDGLDHAGFPADAIPSVGFRIESQETVERDYGGNWQEESEMP